MSATVSDWSGGNPAADLQEARRRFWHESALGWRPTDWPNFLDCLRFATMRYLALPFGSKVPIGVIRQKS